MSVMHTRHYKRIPQLIRRDKGDRSKADFLAHREQVAASLSLLESISVAAVRPEAPALVATADGAIDRVLLTIPNYAVQDPTMSAAYQALLKSLPAATSLVILAQQSARSDVDRWIIEAGRQASSTVDTYEDSLNISIWAEDGYVIAKDEVGGSTYFVEPYAFPRYADSLVGDFVCNFTDLKDTRAPLYFQGGNTLIGDDFFLLGADYPALSLNYIKSNVLTPPPAMSPQDFIKKTYQDYMDHRRRPIYVGSRVPVPLETTRSISVGGENWKEIICAGNHSGTVQPLFHIDMFVTLVAREGEKYTLLVGDPRQAFQLLGSPPPDHAMIAVFDDIAEFLVAQGFNVVRNPLPLVYMDDPERKQREWYFATSNNALVQNAPSKEVWLPTYGYGSWAELKKTDDANRSTWEKLGFTVHQLPDFHPFAENLGAVHCIKKYLARG